MAQKRKTTRRRKTKSTNRRKKGRQSSVTYTANAVGLIMLTLCLLAFFKAGFVGNLAANLIRFVVGDTYPFVSLVGLAVGLALLITGQLPRIASKWLWSIGTMYLGILLWLHVDLFLSENQHTGFLSYTWQLLSSDLLNNSVSTAVGGGTLGAVLLTITNLLVAFGGAKVIAVLLVIIGLMIAFNVSGTQILRWVQVGGRWFGQVAKKGGQMLVRGMRRN